MNKCTFPFLVIFFVLACTSNQDATLELAKLGNPTEENSSLPYLTKTPDGNLLFSWVEKTGDTTILKFSMHSDGNWSAPEEIARGTDWFVNWADYPMVSTNAHGEMIAHYLAKSSSGTYSYDVNMVRKMDDSWTKPFIPHSDGTPTEHGFLTMIPLIDDTYQLAWLDGRNTSSSHEDHHGAMTLRGAILDKDGNLSEEIEFDNKTCDCCQTGGALTENGPIIVYRDRSEMEIRDIGIIRKVNGSWTEPKIIHADNWEIKGCPVNGPRSDAIGNNLVIAWFTGANNNPKVKAIFSADGGETFNTVIDIDVDNPLGRVDVAMIDESSAIVSWLGRSGDQAIIKARIITNDGGYEKPIEIARTSEARGSGFPQMTVIGKQVYFAWTKLGEEGVSQINTANLSLK